MKFTKMHGLGNDYVYVNLFEETVDDPSAVSIAVSDRHFGIGSDGMIMIGPSECADFEMIMYNADGSRGEMCGNGIRCVGKYVYDHRMTDKKEVSIETLGGIKVLALTTDDNDLVTQVRVDMGAPVLEPSEIPVDLSRAAGPAEGAVNPEGAAESDAVLPNVGVPIEVNGETVNVTCVSMGNPHAVRFVDDTKSLDLAKIGPAYENHPLFPNRVNTEFAHVLDREHIDMRVWERGSGETMACGTGACATAVSAILNGLADDHVFINLLGGTLDIFWDRADTGHVFMTGPAVTVFDGEWEE